MELKQLELAEAKARMLLLQPIDEENPEGGSGDGDDEDPTGNIELQNATTATPDGDMVDFAAIADILAKTSIGAEKSNTEKEAAPWRAMLDDDDIIEAPRSYSMPTFKKDLNKMPLNSGLNRSQHK